MFVSQNRKKSASSEPKAKKSRTDKKGKKDKDPNAPKRPPTAFFIFMYANSSHIYLITTLAVSIYLSLYWICLSWYFRDDFRKSFKEANPDSKGVKEVSTNLNTFPSAQWKCIDLSNYYNPCSRTEYLIHFRLQRRVVRNGSQWLMKWVNVRCHLKTCLYFVNYSISHGSQRFPFNRLKYLWVSVAYLIR